MTYFDAQGNALDDATAAELQWNGHPVFDATGAEAKLVPANVPVDSVGNTEVTLSEDARGDEA